MLQRRVEDDKSRFLAQAGYTLENPNRLVADLRSQLLPLDAELIDRGEYGPKYAIRGRLTGPNGKTIRVKTIWMTDNAMNQTKSVTLHPDKS